MKSELARVLASRVAGDVRTDRVTRALYSTDASPYRIEPAAVLRAAEPDDIAAAIDTCREVGVPITARGAGTSLSGQCVGEGLQLDLSLLDRIERVDPEARTARVQPGVTWWQLNEALKPHGLEFGPDPATKRQCTIGGVVGTNAGGTHSVVYGAGVDHVRSAEAVLADGRRVTLGPGWTDLPNDLGERLERIRTDAAPLLDPRFRTLARRSSGYQLEHLCVTDPNPAKLLAGSDGTLALMTSIEVTLDPLPSVRVLGVVGFADMHDAIAVVPALVETSPSAVELVSKSLLDVARRSAFHGARVREVDPSLGSLLLVEYQGDSFAEAAAGLVRMERTVVGAPFVGRYTDPVAMTAMWEIREAGVGALSSIAGGPLLPQAFVEDTIVAVDRLPGYIRELDSLFARHGMEVVWYGHASTGLIHTRPFLDMTSARDLRRLKELMGDAVDLVNAWGGDLCGEHGDGLARTYWNERLFGPELYEQLRAVKRAFDPHNLLNPGKVVEGPELTENLRYGPGYRRLVPATRFRYDDQGGFAAATERCFGAGVCRKRLQGTMCPPAAVTGLEEHSTRARANLLRSVVSGHLDPHELTTDEAWEVMGTCVACKACKTECPAQVDMARLKSEWLDMARHAQGATPLQRTIANLRSLSAVGSRATRVANRVLGTKRFKRSMGIALQRELPPLAPKPLTALVRVREGDALLFADCFTNFQEPHIGEALSGLLRETGCRLGLVDAGCCGRTMISEGYVDKARRSAERAARRLRATDGPILFCEPSCLSAVADDWPHLIGDVTDIAVRARAAEAYVTEVGGALGFRQGGDVLLHGHCHQKALWGTTDTRTALALAGVDVAEPDSGCCGMAGGFGYRAERYHLSVAMGERVLAPAVRDAAGAEVVATGTSCRHQIADLTGRESVHPLVFLHRRLVGA